MTLRPSWAILENPSTEAGVPWHHSIEGDAASARNAAAALIAKDTAGNLQYPKVNLDRELIVSSQANDYATLGDDGSHAGSLSYQTLAEIALQTDYVYEDLQFVVSCFRDTKFQVIQSDNTVESVLFSGIRTDAGNTSNSVNISNFALTTGSTGVQKIIIKGKNLNALSEMNATMYIKEVQPDQ
jgi:hypothetical protein